MKKKYLGTGTPENKFVIIILYSSNLFTCNAYKTKIKFLNIKKKQLFFLLHRIWTLIISVSTANSYYCPLKKPALTRKKKILNTYL